MKIRFMRRENMSRCDDRDWFLDVALEEVAAFKPAYELVAKVVGSSPEKLDKIVSEQFDHSCYAGDLALAPLLYKVAQVVEKTKLNDDDTEIVVLVIGEDFSGTRKVKLMFERALEPA